MFFFLEISINDSLHTGYWVTPKKHLYNSESSETSNTLLALHNQRRRLESLVHLLHNFIGRFPPTHFLQLNIREIANRHISFHGFHPLLSLKFVFVRPATGKDVMMHFFSRATSNNDQDPSEPRVPTTMAYIGDPKLFLLLAPINKSWQELHYFSVGPDKLVLQTVDSFMHCVFYDGDHY